MYQMGKNFSKLNVKAQYCCSRILNSNLMMTQIKLFFQHDRSFKITTEYVKPVNKEGAKALL